MRSQSEVTSFRVLQRPKKTHIRKTTCPAPPTVHNIPVSNSSLPGHRYSYDLFSVSSVCSVVSDGFRLKTPLLNNRTRNLRGLKPTLRLLDRGGTNARAKQGHVIPRYSAFFRGQKKDTHTLAKQPVLPRTVHNTPASAFSVP